MGVNLVLGLVPLALALVLFRRGRRTTPLWWCGVVVFVLFLPNAPYLLTNYRWLRGPWVNAWHHNRWRFGTILPVWMLYFAIGFALFAASVRLAERFVAERWGATTGRVTVVALTAGCAVGMYLGRSDLFSWTVVTGPGDVVEAVGSIGSGSGTNIVLAFVVLLAGYGVTRWALPRLDVARRAVGRAPTSTGT
jgi:uncharacterized membrane protein